MKLKTKNSYISIIIILILILISIKPETNIKAFYNGIKVWATIVLPALFPFFLFTKLLTELNVIQDFCKCFSKITKKFYNCDGVAGYIFFSSIISGYPVGAKLVSEFHTKKLITTDQAYRITTFTSTSGPLFIIGTIGIGMFNNKTIGLIILVSHILASLINGLLYRKHKLNNSINNLKIQTLQNKTPTTNILNECMINSIKSILIIGGYISIFFLLTNIISTYNLFNPITFFCGKIFNSPNSSEIINGVLNGLIEVTQGCLKLSSLKLNQTLSIVLCTGLVSFGGFSIHMQAQTFLKSAGIKYSFFLIQKLTHSFISIVISFILSFLL